MRSMLLTATLGLAALGLLPAAESSAEAQSQRGRGPISVDVGGPRGSARVHGYSGPSRYYGRYYDGYYYPRYYDRYYSYSTPYYSYYSTPRYSSSYSYGPSYSSRYGYYWSGGYYICYDRHTGDYWYRDGGYWHRWY